MPSLDAVIRLGRLHPDEVFQSLEPALRLAFGYGTVAWEWERGLRNHFVPGLFAALLKLAHWVGVNDPWLRRAVLELPQFALNIAMVHSVFRFAARRIGPRHARWAVVLLLAWGPWVWFAGRTLGESISAAFLVWGLERLDDESLGDVSAYSAGVLLGLAEITRYGSAAFILPALVFLAVRRRFTTLRSTLLGGLTMAALLGVVDRLTWGHFFHSLTEYLDFNLFTRGGASFGRSPAYWYVTQWLVAPLGLLAVGLFAWRREPKLRSWLFVTSTLVYLVAISATAHKELRFAYPALLLCLVAVAPAVIHFIARGRLRAVLGIAAVLSVTVLYRVKTPFDVERGDLFRATIFAGRGDGTGLLVINEGPWGTGGSFYLGKDLPWCACDEPEQACFVESLRNPAVNRALYVVDLESEPRNRRVTSILGSAGFQETQRVGGVAYFERRVAVQ